MRTKKALFAFFIVTIFLLTACTQQYVIFDESQSFKTALTPESDTARGLPSVISSMPPNNDAEPSHYSPQQISALNELMVEDIGITVDNGFLAENYSSIECRGYVSWTIHRAYGIYDNNIFDLARPYIINSPNYHLLAQLAYAGTYISADMLLEFFDSLEYGDVLQMHTTATWHSAFYMGYNDIGIIMLDANYKWDNKVNLHNVAWGTFASSLNAAGMGISGYQIVNSGEVASAELS